MPRIRECHDGLFEDAIAERVIAAFQGVHAALGSGHAAPVYRRALVIAIARRGLEVRSQCAAGVVCEGAVVGTVHADLVIESRVAVQVVSARTVAPEDEASLEDYLRATEVEVGLLLHFGAAPAVRRLAWQACQLSAPPPSLPGPRPAPPRTACPTP